MARGAPDYQRVGRTGTEIVAIGDHIAVVYRGTPCVLWPHRPTEVILNTGTRPQGEVSTTLKRRMNQASRQFGLGFRVFQRNYKLYVEHEGVVRPFDEERIVLGGYDE